MSGQKPNYLQLVSIKRRVLWKKAAYINESKDRYRRAPGSLPSASANIPYIPALPIHMHHLDCFMLITLVFNVLLCVYCEQLTNRQRSVLSVRLCLCLRGAVDHSE